MDVSFGSSRRFTRKEELSDSAGRVILGQWFESTTLDSSDIYSHVTTLNDVADLLEIMPDRLRYVLFSASPDRYYKTWQISKRSGGTRDIHAPTSSVYFLQQRFRALLEQNYIPRHSTHGYVKGRSVVTNAELHVAKRFVLNIDLKDFFRTIHFGRVRGVLMGQPFGFPLRSATILARLCCFDGALAVGASTSPVLSNLICRGLDRDLQRLAGKHNCRYTRYADDLTFSTNRQIFPSQLAQKDAGVVVPGSALVELLERHGFEVNHDKVRLRHRSVRQEVTGITVNARLNNRRRLLREIRGMLNAWDVYGEEAASRRFVENYSKDRHQGAAPTFRSVLLGKISYCKMVRGGDDALVERMYLQFNNLSEGRSRSANLSEHAAERAARSTKPVVRILHISDLHFKASQGWDSIPMLERLIAFCRKEHVSPDILAITGDIAFSGKEHEFELAENWLNQLLAVLKLTPDQVFVVPGNHDVDRDLSSPTMTLMADSLRDYSQGDRNLVRILSNKAESAILLERLGKYVEFGNRMSGRSDELPWWSRELKVGEHLLRVVGLCSPLLSEGEDNGKLILGLPIVMPLFSGGPVDLTITLLHHPLGWLHERESSVVRDEVLKASDIILSGHVHRADQDETIRHGHRFVQLGAGSTSQGSELDNSIYYLEVSPSNAVCNVRVARWAHTGTREWIWSRDAFHQSGDGTGVFNLDQRPGHSAIGSS